MVNNTTLPAGTYVITVLDPYASDLSVLEIAALSVAEEDVERSGLQGRGLHWTR